MSNSSEELKRTSYYQIIDIGGRFGVENCVMSLSSGLPIVFNGFILVLMVVKKKLQQQNIFIFNLALSDLVTALGNLFLYIVSVTY